MRGVSVILIIGLSWASAQFLNNQPFPTYSLENMPDTQFSCRDKILGGYYADADTQCQMFHVCVKVAGVGVQDFRFLCPNGTAFDQDHQICADWEDVDCDATTLYYSSDNFDLYRLGSGFESKARKYGEDEETFALQRAETGDARLNRDHQTQRVNQQKENVNQYYKKNQQKQVVNNNQEDRDIFKGSSSSNFFNNRNNGKEIEDDYDDNVNVNQDNDYAQKKKTVRKQQRRPVQNDQNNNQYNQNNQQTTKIANQQQTSQRVKNVNQQVRHKPQNTPNQYNQEETTRSQRPTGFVNNFAGSSYVPTTARSTSTTLNNDQYTAAVNNHRVRNGQRHRINTSDRQYNNADNFRQTQVTSTPSYTVSTPIPFRQTQQYNNVPSRSTVQPNNNNDQSESITTAPAFNNFQQNSNFNTQFDIPKLKPKQIDNFPGTSSGQPFAKQANNDFDGRKASPTTKQTDNYPSNNPQYKTFEVKKSTTAFQQTENYPTTFTPKTKAYYQGTTQNNGNQKSDNNYPTTFSPKLNQGYSQISQHTVQYKNTQPQNTQNTQISNQNPPAKTQGAQQFKNQNSQHTQQNTQPSTTQFIPSNNNNQFNNNNNHNQRNNSPTPIQQSTPRSTPFTQYTPTVPKISSTTPVSRSNRFDETQYDDGSYNPKFDYDGDKKDDEFLKTAHSQNIASSRNEFARTSRKPQPVQVTQKPYHESPRPFSTNTNSPKATENPKSHANVTPRNSQKVDSQPAPKSPKKTKDVSYDYAYYDTNIGSEPDYDINTDIKKSTVTK